MSAHDTEPTSTRTDAGRRRTPAEEARTLVSSMTVGYLATVGEDGAPWSSLVVYGPTAEGNPVLLVSTLAEHGRNLAADPRASLAISDPAAPGDPLDRPRITLAGRAVAAIPGARLYAGWEDFSVWVLEVQRVRWVGGFAQMDTVSHDEYVAAEPDPTAPMAAAHVAKLNKEHADGLLAIAREIAGARGAVSAIATGLDRHGLDLSVTGAGQAAAVRVAFEPPLGAAKEIRPAALELVRRAYAAQARAGSQPEG
jgi:heme oxygenase (biliverdin-IX-beta and delta-forming)